MTPNMRSLLLVFFQPQQDLEDSLNAVFVDFPIFISVGPLVIL